MIVLEVSSFMAHWLGRSTLSPCMLDFTIFTNMQTDHLNWHRDVQEYVDAKMRLAAYTKHTVVMNALVEDFVKEKKIHWERPTHARMFSSDRDHTPRDWTDGEVLVV